MLVSTNKLGYPGAYCFKCETQVQPRDDRGSLLLMGRIHTWENDKAAELMLEAADLEYLSPSIEPKAGTIPPHLVKNPPAESRPPAAPEPAPRTPTEPAPASPPPRAPRAAAPRPAKAPATTKPTSMFGDMFK